MRKILTLCIEAVKEMLSKVRSGEEEWRGAAELKSISIDDFTYLMRELERWLSACLVEMGPKHDLSSSSKAKLPIE